MVNKVSNLITIEAVAQSTKPGAERPAKLIEVAQLGAVG
jgi:hypothetical protein